MVEIYKVCPIVIQLAQQLRTPSVERLISSYTLIHSKLRNILGNDKPN